MKHYKTVLKFIVNLLFLLPFRGWGQGYLGISVGRSFGCYTNDKVPLKRNLTFVNLHVGYYLHNNNDKSIALVEYDQRSPLSRQMHNTFFGLKAGPVIHIGNQQSIEDGKDLQLIPSLGYYYALVTTDDKSLNGAVPGYGLRVLYKGAFIEANYIRKTPQVSIGMAGLMKRRR